MKRTLLFKITLLVFGMALMLPLDMSAQNNYSKYTFYAAYDTEEIIRDRSKVATIISLTGLDVDGTEAAPANMRYANHTPSRPYWVVADVIPGKHDIKVLYYGDEYYIEMDPIEFEFESGKIYRMEMKIWRWIVKEFPNDKAREQIDAMRERAEYQEPQR